MIMNWCPNILSVFFSFAFFRIACQRLSARLDVESDLWPFSKVELTFCRFRADNAWEANQSYEVGKVGLAGFAGLERVWRWALQMSISLSYVVQGCTCK